MDIERTLQFVVENQAQFVADLQELRAVTQKTASLQLEQAKNHNELIGVVRDLAEIQRRSEEDRRRAEEEWRRGEEDRRRAEEENRLAHQRFEELHRETDQRFNILIKMMDEWIRERRNGRGAPDTPSS